MGTTFGRQIVRREWEDVKRTRVKREGGVGRTRVGKEGEVSGLRENEWVRKEGRVRKRGRGREENMRV